MLTKKRTCGFSRTSIIRRRKALLAAAAKDKTPVPEDIKVILRNIKEKGFKSLAIAEQDKLAKERTKSRKINLLARQANLYYSLRQIRVHLAAKR